MSVPRDWFGVDFDFLHGGPKVSSGIVDRHGIMVGGAGRGNIG
jgi:hypothetical protein